VKRSAALVLALGAPLMLTLCVAGAATPPSLTPVLAAPDWLNGRVSNADVAGKVVIVDVFTFDCINCKHVTPNLQRLHANMSPNDLTIIGVHAPETPAERERANVVRELARQGVVWPVALDNSFTVWKALNNEYWPTQYIFDRHGMLRRTIVGEGQDDVVTATVQALIAEHH
jgi:thiol-disulfide isomerase/thioredoxin